MNTVYSLGKWKVLGFPLAAEPLHTQTSAPGHAPPSGWGGHMTAPQLSRDPGQKDWKVLLCMHIFPLVDGQFPQVSLIFELEYEDIAF